MTCSSKGELQKHLHMADNFDGNNFPWDDDSYLKPFLQDDPLLYSFCENDDDEECDGMSIDTRELESYLSQIEHIDIHDESSSDRCASELIVPCENGAKGVVSSSCKDMTDRENEIDDIPSTKIVAKEIKSINKNYFGAYSSFGIHREMISDKVPSNIESAK